MDIADRLQERAGLIGHACRHIPDNMLWRWHDYDWHTKLRINELRNNATEIDYRRPEDKYAAMYLTNVRPLPGLDNEKVEEIPSGELKIIDGLTIEANNFNGLSPLPIHYDAGFEKSRSKEDALAIGFTQKVSTEFGVEVKAVSFKVGLELESRQDITHTEGSTETESRTAGLSPECPPGCDITYRMSRTVQPTKLRLSGNRQVEHGITIGKHQRGSWQKHDSGRKKYRRYLEWDSFAQFMEVIKGEGRRDWDAAMWFREHPAPQWLIDRLEKPLTIPYTSETPEFDGWTKLKPHQELLRGPNPAVLKQLEASENPEALGIVMLPKGATVTTSGDHSVILTKITKDFEKAMESMNQVKNSIAVLSNAVESENT